MNNTLEIALKTARTSRDWGNFILAIGILAEIAIDAFWPERSSVLIVLRGSRATHPLKTWHLPLFTSKGLFVVLAGLVVLYGLNRERTEGTKVDGITDEIRAIQLKRIAYAETEDTKLLRLVSGREIIMDQ